MTGLRSFAWIVAVLSISTASAQKYPRWFLSPETVSCTDAAVGYDNGSIYQDSTGGRAFLNAVENYVRFRQESVSGETGYLSGERGTMVVGSTLHETVDSAEMARWQQILIPGATMKTKDLTLVLACPKSCTLRGEDGLLVDVASRRTPPWIQDMSGEQGVFTAVGVAQGFFYEASSWLAAERAARLELAKQMQSQTSALQKRAAGFEETKTVSTGAVIAGVRVIARWRDVVHNLFYVLVRMDRGTPSSRPGP